MNLSLGGGGGGNGGGGGVVSDGGSCGGGGGGFISGGGGGVAGDGRNSGEDLGQARATPFVLQHLLAPKLFTLLRVRATQIQASAPIRVTKFAIDLKLLSLDNIDHWLPSRQSSRSEAMETKTPMAR